jgi:hypothetical protein
VTPEEAIAVQAETLWSHIPAELRPPPGELGVAKIMSDGLLQVIHGERWFVLAREGAAAWTWTASHPNPGALEVVEYVHGWESGRDIVPT